MSDKKIFPIKQGVACQLKWTWNVIRLMEGTTACCHRVQAIPLQPGNFDNFHNYPTWVNHRNLQLQGLFPDQGCQYCGDVEAAGGVSDRMNMSKVPGIYPKELDNDPTATVVTPRVIEVFLDNTCNLSCVYCDESNSTRIQKENEKFGYNVTGIPDNIVPIQRIKRSDNSLEFTEDFFKYLKNNYSDLRRLDVLGGEPFYQKNFFRLVEFIKNNSNPDLELHIITNLMCSNRVLETFVNDMKSVVAKRKLKRLNITASLDGIGPEQEYIRFGLKFDQWNKNLKFLADQKWIYLTVNACITSLSIPSLPKLLDYIQSFADNGRRIHFGFNNVNHKDILNPKIFGSNFFNEWFDQVLDKIEKNPNLDQSVYDHFKGLCLDINQHAENIKYQQYLKYYLEELDLRRGTKWQENFPHLAAKLNTLNDFI